MTHRVHIFVYLLDVYMRERDCMRIMCARMYVCMYKRARARVRLSKKKKIKRIEG